MGGFFGITSTKECLLDVFFGVDYHSHLGTKRAGLACYDKKIGLQRKIHNIENAPFRTKFEHIFEEMTGTAAIGCISDTDPQPMLMRSHLGAYAICTIGIINNQQELIDNCLAHAGCHFDAMTGGRVNSTELVSALIDQKNSFAEGIKYVQDNVDGTVAIMILKQDGHIIAARDKRGTLPVLIGKREDDYAVSFESYAYLKMGFEDYKELEPGEVVELSTENYEQLLPPAGKKKICAFLWSYYGYPTSTYEGVNVEIMRYKNGRILAEHDKDKDYIKDIDYVGGVPDSGTPHAIGYANASGIPFARAFIKYTPTWSRSFMPSNQTDRNKIAKMKQIPVKELIEGKNLLFVDDSIVRGTQLKETVEFLYENGAKSVHMRSACPPIMFGCKYLNFSAKNDDMDLISRRVIDELEGPEGLNHLDEYCDYSTERGQKLRDRICESLHFDSLEFQSLDGIVEAIGIPECELCTYCWNGKE